MFRPLKEHSHNELFPNIAPDDGTRDTQSVYSPALESAEIDNATQGGFAQEDCDFNQGGFSEDLDNFGYNVRHLVIRLTHSHSTLNYLSLHLPPLQMPRTNPKIRRHQWTCHLLFT